MDEYAFLENEQAKTKRINFGHPAYPLGEDILFSLPAFDHPQGGIYHFLAKSICAIITDNRYDGYLSLSRAGDTEAVEAELDDILKIPKNGGAYYYHLQTVNPNISR